MNEVGKNEEQQKKEEADSTSSPQDKPVQSEENLNKSETSEIKQDKKKNVKKNKKQKAIKSKVSKQEPHQQNFDESNSNQTRSRDLVSNIVVLYGLLAFTAAVVYVVYTNPSIGYLSDDTRGELNQAVNAIALLSIPFILGTIGATARILISDVRLFSSIKQIAASGIFAIISWIGIKSKVFLSLLTPYVEKTTAEGAVVIDQLSQVNDNAFYSLAFVALLVGMFSSNLYVMMNTRVEQLTNKG